MTSDLPLTVVSWSTIIARMEPIADDSTSLPPLTQAHRLYAYLGISALLSLATWMLLLLPNFLQERGWSSQRIGWAVGCYFIVHLVTQIVAGQFADRHGNVPTALAGSGLACAGAGFYLAALWDPLLIFPARMLHAVGVATVSAAVLLLLVNSVPARLKGRMIGYFGLPGFVMLGVGPFVSEAFIYRWGFQGTFLCILGIFLAVAGILSRLPRPLAPRGSRQPFSKALRASIPGLKPVLMFSIFFGFCFSAWNSFLAPTVKSVGAGGVSSFGLGYGVGAVMTRLGVSHRLDSGYRRLAAISSLLAYAAALVLIPHAQEIWHLVVLGLLCGMSHGTYYPGLSSIASERFHPLHTGQALSLYLSASSLGMFVGPPLWGALADVTGYVTIFAAAGTILALSTSYFVLTQWRHMRRVRAVKGSL